MRAGCAVATASAEPSAGARRRGAPVSASWTGRTRSTSSHRRAVRCGEHDASSTRPLGPPQALRHARRRPNEPRQRDLADEREASVRRSTPLAAEASAAAIARSQAGSSTLTPPDAAPKSSARPSADAGRAVQHRRHQLEPAGVETRSPGAVAGPSGRSDERLHLDGERAPPASGSAMAAPGAPLARHEQRGGVDSVQARRGHLEPGALALGAEPVLATGEDPQTRTASPSNDSTTSTACSSARGPARSPSLVTCPVMRTAIPSRLRQPDQRVGAQCAPGRRHRASGNRMCPEAPGSSPPPAGTAPSARATAMTDSRDRAPVRTTPSRPRSPAVRRAPRPARATPRPTTSRQAARPRRGPARPAAAASTCRCPGRPPGARPTRERARRPGPGRRRRCPCGRARPTPGPSLTVATTMRRSRSLGSRRSSPMPRSPDISRPTGRPVDGTPDTP